MLPNRKHPLIDQFVYRITVTTKILLCTKAFNWEQGIKAAAIFLGHPSRGSDIGIWICSLPKFQIFNRYWKASGKQ